MCTPIHANLEQRIPGLLIKLGKEKRTTVTPPISRSLGTLLQSGWNGCSAVARVIFLISKLGVEFDNSKSRLFTSEFYRASEKTCKFLKIGAIIPLVARPTDRQPISRSWKIQDQLSQPMTRLLMQLCTFGKARQIQLPNHQTKEISKRWPDNERH